ncbi:MAG: hypothetical protein JSU96_17950 [Acidobacteriota bacterium]|nr:MAG: hypothetical protein JSU96_17950 [Acidobacteriota bacterium]
MLDDQLRNHRKKLEKAINEALTDSPHVAKVIREIREDGFDVFLIIEATVGFSQRQEVAEEVRQLPAVRLELTTKDEDFLKSLKIRPN